jgi:ATP-dependent DNA helicase DinG
LRSHFKTLITPVTDINSFFSSNGALAQVISGYNSRTAQMEMAQAVDWAITNGQHLIVEAGTGTGKTFAYLVPAILSGKKIVVSTGTKNLQEQLFYNDIPILRKALTKEPFSATLLKGRANYLCTHRLDYALSAHQHLTKQEAYILGKIKAWAKRTKTGDIAEMTEVSESEPLWYQATSTRDNCLGQDCPDYSECFVMKARRKAQEADVVIVNHYLLCADWSLREIGFGELLPNADAIVIDEAHQLANVASNFLGLSLSAKQFVDLSDDSLAAYLEITHDMPDLKIACEKLKLAVKDVRLAFGLELKKGEWQELENQPQLYAALIHLQKQLAVLTQQLEHAAERSKELELCLKRAEEMDAQLAAIVEDKTNKTIRWYETHKNSFTLNSTPLDIAAAFSAFMQQHQAAWIFTSATLSVAGKFDYFSKNLGLYNVVSYRWESPFDYQSQALFYHPKGLPEATDPDFTDKIVEFAIPVLQASQGRAFFLFTSYKALNRAEELLQEKLDFPLLVQGSYPKTVLLERFKQHGNAVLLGTSSFWEGVDVRGEALSCVIIDKLPFASPGDPVLKARLEAMKKQGRNAFFEYQLPTAAIALKQGVGRLIRDVDDKGVLMVCDPRLLKKGYGQIFLNSVPPMRRTRDIAEVVKFFKS